MSDPKHTPGPWGVRRGGDGHIRQVVGANGRIVSRWNGLAAPTSTEGEANALLIATAPELLDMLEECIDALGSFIPDDSEEGPPVWLGTARRIAAKARGGS